MANYHVDGRELNLLIADFPTPQTAQKKLNEFNRNSRERRSQRGDGFTPLYGKRAITLLAIVSERATKRKPINCWTRFNPEQKLRGTSRHFNSKSRRSLR